MNRPTFLRGALVAGILAFATAAVVATLAPFVGFGSVVRPGIAAVAFTYVLYLLRVSRERTGNITILSLWIALALAAWWLAPPLPFYLVIHAAAIWLVRSLYFHTGVLPSLADLGLTALSICALTWAGTRTGSVFLATWSFFLVQALFVVIPPAIGRRRVADMPVDNAGFDHAKRRADAAIRVLAGR